MTDRPCQSSTILSLDRLTLDPFPNISEIEVKVDLQESLASDTYHDLFVEFFIFRDYFCCCQFIPSEKWPRVYIVFKENILFESQT